MNPSCYFCGRFFSWNEPHYVWTPYGNQSMSEPPGGHEAHQKCFEEKADALLWNTSWLKPFLVDINEKAD